MSTRRAVLPDAHAGDAHPVVGLRLGDEFLHVAVRHDHQPLARVRHRSDAVRLVARQPRRADQAGDGAEFVGREEAGQGRRLHRKRRFEFEELAQLGFGVVSVAGKPSQSRSSAASSGGSPGSG